MISIALGVFWLFVVILWITHKRSIFPLSIYWEAAVGFGGDDYSNYVDYVVHNKDLVLALFECSVRVGVSENGTAQQAGHWKVRWVETL